MRACGPRKRAQGSAIREGRVTGGSPALKLEAAGYPGHKAPWDAFWGQRYAVAVDPDGNHVSLFAPLEE